MTVTNVRFPPESGQKADVAACLIGAISRHRLTKKPARGRVLELYQYFATTGGLAEEKLGIHRPIS